MIAATARPQRSHRATDDATRPLVLVTGASGLIGTRVCTDLARDHRVVGLDIEMPGPDHPAHCIECDLTREASARSALVEVAERFGTRIASVIHLAAYYDFSGEESPLYEELTVRGTERLLDALREQGFDVQQFVFSSSLLVMEPVSEKGQVVDEDSALEAEWAYPRSKLAAEKMLRERGDRPPVVILRIAGVYDADCHSIPIAQQMWRIAEKSFESIVFPGNAEHGQPFVHLDDLVACFRKTIERRGSLGDLELFLIGEPSVVSYESVQDIVGYTLHGQSWPTIRIPVPIAKVGAWLKSLMPGAGSFIKPWMVELADQHMPISIERARRLLDWEPRHRLRDELPGMALRLAQDPRRWCEIQGIEPKNGVDRLRFAGVGPRADEPRRGEPSSMDQSE